MSLQSVGELAEIDANTEPAWLLPRQRNLIASPLLRLPTELIFKIFRHAIGLDNDEEDDENPSLWEGSLSLLALVSTCHKLREVGITTPRLWSTNDLSVPAVAELFLER